LRPSSIRAGSGSSRRESVMTATVFPLVGSGPSAREGHQESEPIQALTRTTRLPWAQGKPDRRSIQPSTTSLHGSAPRQPHLSGSQQRKLIFSENSIFHN